jgi:hypothetical protein
MSWSATLCAATLAAAIAAATLGTVPARAADEAGKMGPGKAAAHAALREGADVPPTPPKLPELPTTKARSASSATTAGKEAASTDKARAQAQKHAADDSRAAHIDEANRAAQGSVAAAAGNANADAHAAAGQARAAAARAAARARGASAGGHP